MRTARAPFTLEAFYYYTVALIGAVAAWAAVSQARSLNIVDVATPEGPRETLPTFEPTSGVSACVSPTGDSAGATRDSCSVSEGQVASLPSKAGAQMATQDNSSDWDRSTN